MGPIGLPELIIMLHVTVLITIVGIVPFWFICKKAGLTPWLSLIFLLPFGAVILPFIVAFTQWPATQGKQES